MSGGQNVSVIYVRVRLFVQALIQMLTYYEWFLLSTYVVLTNSRRWSLSAAGNSTPSPRATTIVRVASTVLLRDRRWVSTLPLLFRRMHLPVRTLEP